MKFSRLFLFSIVFCFFLSVFTTLWTLLLSERVSLSSFLQNEPVNVSWEIVSTNIGSTSIKLEDLESNVQGIASKVSPSVVSIIISQEVPVYRTDPFGFFYEPSGKVKKAVGGGSGFFVSKDGYILTNKHVVNNPSAEYSVILSDWRELKWKVLALDPTTDLAIMRAFKDENTPFSEAIPLASISSIMEIQVGSFVIAIGNALAEFQNTLTFGVISGLGRSIEAGNSWNGEVEALSGLIQTDAAINPGNSWGPLLNLHSQVIGINTAVSAGANGIGFAIPLSQKIVNGILDSVKKNGKITRSFLGVYYVPVTPELVKKYELSVFSGAYIPLENSTSVVPNSPAERSGIEKGDVIVEVNGETLTRTRNLKEILAETLPGEIISLKVVKKWTKQPRVISLSLWESH